MVLGYLGKSFTYDQVKQLLRTSPHGTIFSHLKYLEALSVTVILGNGDMSTLRQYLAEDMPVIVAVETGELTSYWLEACNHAVVVIGFDQNMVALNDPEFRDAPKLVDALEFELAWHEMDYRFAVIQAD